MLFKVNLFILNPEQLSRASLGFFRDLQPDPCTTILFLWKYSVARSWPGKYRYL